MADIAQRALVHCIIIPIYQDESSLINNTASNQKNLKTGPIATRLGRGVRQLVSKETRGCDCQCCVLV